ncbi:MAG: hypothetical protein F7B06_05095 [Opitutae bacterium]|nr:hypothetical protein [Opitutae bacterium]
MNRSLLLIVCDFLLISLLALARFETPEEEGLEQEVMPEDPLQAQEDIIDALKLSLELEQESNQNMAASLQKAQEQLDETANSLQARESALEQARREGEILQRDNRDLQTDLEDRIAVLERKEKQVGDLSVRLEKQEKEAEEQVRQMEALQSELKEGQAAMAAAEARQKELEKANREAELQAHALDTQLQLAETETRLVRQNLELARSEVSIIRNENQRLQEHASQLATLAAIEEEVRQSQPRSRNAIFADFMGSGMTIEVRYQESSRDGDERLVTVQPVIVRDGEGLKALFTWSDLRLSESDLRNQELDFRGAIRLSNESHPLGKMDFLSLDTRVIVVQLEKAWEPLIETKPFQIALEPLMFPRAVLVDREKGHYGEAPFKLDIEARDNIRVDSRLMNRLMGEYSPRKSNVMFSQAGDLLGVMVNRKYAAQVDNFLPGVSVTSGRGEATLQDLQQAYTRMINQVRRLPEDLR